MYTTYILKSEKEERYYIGFTSELSQRLKKHNSGSTASTKPFRPWKVVYTESFSDKRVAWLRERQIKSYKGGEAFHRLLRDLAKGDDQKLINKGGVA